MSNANRIVEGFKAVVATCPLPPAIDLIGEKWSFLILRGAMNGLQHFEEFQAGLGIARNILSDRLVKLVCGGVLQRTPDPADRRKVIYALTDKGRDLLPTLIALRQWGENWGSGDHALVLADKDGSRPVRRIAIEAEDGRELKLEDLQWVEREPAELEGQARSAA